MSEAPFKLPLRALGDEQIIDAADDVIADCYGLADRDYIIAAANTKDDLIAALFECAELRLKVAKLHGENERLRALCRVHEETIITVVEKHAELREENARLAAELATLKEYDSIADRRRRIEEVVQARRERDAAREVLAERDADERVLQEHINATFCDVEAVENALNTYCERLADEVDQLRGALNDCADDLESLVEDRYKITKDAYPIERAHYERDIAPVKAARTLLEPKP